jgi:hypothetical protein
MVVFRDLPQTPMTDILDRAFHIKNNFFDAGNGCILPQKYRDVSEQVKNLEIRDDDVFLCSFPRTGSTWLQEILWLLGNDLDFEKAKNIVQQVSSLLLLLELLVYLENTYSRRFAIHFWSCQHYSPTIRIALNG